MTAWILVANASEAHLYSSKNLRNKDLNLVKEIFHPESREKGIDLTSDRPGHYQTNHKTRSAYEKSHPKKDEAEAFARQLAELLKNSHNEHNFEQLVLIASPKFYGLLNKNIDFTLDNFTHIAKDYTKLTVKDLGEQLHKNLYV